MNQTIYSAFYANKFGIDMDVSYVLCVGKFQRILIQGQSPASPG